VRAHARRTARTHVDGFGAPADSGVLWHCQEK
jgi:hypothetical protein